MLSEIPKLCIPTGSAKAELYSDFECEQLEHLELNQRQSKKFLDLFASKSTLFFVSKQFQELSLAEKASKLVRVLFPRPL